MNSFFVLFFSALNSKLILFIKAHPFLHQVLANPLFEYIHLVQTSLTFQDHNKGQGDMTLLSGMRRCCYFL